MTKSLYFVRHGDTETTESNKMHPDEAEVGLSEKGEMQVQALARRLQTENIEVIHISPSRRTVETAEIITSICEIPTLIVDKRIVERRWGDWSERGWTVIKNDLDKMSLDQRYEFIPPGGESWQQFENRLKDFFQEMIVSGSQKILIVTHMGCIRALFPLILKKPKEITFELDFAPASLTKIVFAGDEASVKIQNDISHL